MKILKVLLVLFCCMNFSADGEQLWKEYFANLDQAERLFWRGVCGAGKGEFVGNHKIFQQVSNCLYQAKAIAIEIEKRVPRRRKNKEMKMSAAVQDMRFFLESMQKHPITKWNSLDLYLTNFSNFGTVPFEDENGATQYKKIFQSSSLRDVDLEQYREWLVLCLRHHKQKFELERPCYPKVTMLKAGGRNNVRGEARKIISTHNKCTKAVEDYLEIMTRLRIISANFYHETHGLKRAKEEPLWDKFFRNLNQVEKLFWDAICCADKDEYIGYEFLFEAVDNHLFIVRETAVEIERCYPYKFRVSKGGNIVNLVQDLRFFFECLQKKPETKWNSIRVLEHDIENSVAPPENGPDGLDQYISDLAGFYRQNYSVRVCFCMTKNKVNCVPCPRMVLNLNEHAKYRQKSIEALNRYLKYMIKIRIASADLYQKRAMMKMPSSKQLREQEEKNAPANHAEKDTKNRTRQDRSGDCLYDDSMINGQRIPDVLPEEKTVEEAETAKIPELQLDLEKIEEDEENGFKFSKDKKSLLKAASDVSGEYKIPDGVEVIEVNAFENCVELQSVIIPDSVRSIGMGAFGGCSKLQRVKLSRGIEVIEAATFMDCSELRSTDIPCGVEIIGAKAFYNCTMLQRVNIPDSVTVIKQGAFAKCEKLQRVNLPKKLTVISRDLFHSCFSLKEVNIPSAVTEIQRNAFRGVKKITSYNRNFFVDRKGVLFDCKQRRILSASPDLKGSYEIFNDIRSIENGAFANCSKLREVVVWANIPVVRSTFHRNTHVIKSSAPSSERKQ